MAYNKNNYYNKNRNKNYKKSYKKKNNNSKLISWLLSLIILSTGGYLGAKNPNIQKYINISEIKKIITGNDKQKYIEPAKITDEKLEYAKSNQDDFIIPHDYFTIGYNKSTLQANWVGYYLSKSRLIDSKSSRTEDFREDEYCPLPRATLDDYRRSGYDRGHLAPAADFKFDKDAMSQTFLLSNMSPQLHDYNAGIWAKLESVVRRNAYEYGNLYVITGPYFNPNKEHKTIGANKIGVPDGYYKALLVYNDNEKKAIAFYIPHSNDEKSNLAKYAMSVDSLEELLGIDCFYNLPDDDENKLESDYNISLWTLREYQK